MYGNPSQVFNDFDAGAIWRAKISELSPVTGLPAQICWPRPELRDRLRFTAVSSIFILQAFAWAEIVGSVCIPTQSTKSILGGLDEYSAYHVRYFWDAATDLFGKVSSFGPGWLF